MIMPTRQMKESSEQHFVIKPQCQNSMNSVQKNPKTAQNGKGPPTQETENTKLHNQPSPPLKNRGRRRGRGGRKSNQGDTFMRPSSRSCTAANKPILAEPAGVVEATATNRDLYKTWHDPACGTVGGGMIRCKGVNCFYKLLCWLRNGHKCHH